MEIYERIMEFRKSQKLSRRAFGDRLGVSEGVIVNIELNRLARPDQKEPLYKLICKEGEPYSENLNEDEYMRAAAEIGVKDPRAKQAILDYWNLSEEDKKLFWSFMERFVIKKEGDV